MKKRLVYKSTRHFGEAFKWCDSWIFIEWRAATKTNELNERLMLMHVLYKIFNSCQMMFPACGVNVSILVNVDELFEKYRAQHERWNDDDDVPFARLEQRSLTFYVLCVESFLHSVVSTLRKNKHHLPKMRKKNWKFSKTSCGSISSLAERKEISFRYRLCM